MVGNTDTGHDITRSIKKNQSHTIRCDLPTKRLLWVTLLMTGEMLLGLDYNVSLSWNVSIYQDILYNKQYYIYHNILYNTLLGVYLICLIEYIKILLL